MDMWKKLIAPVVIVILLVAYLLTIGGWFLFHRIRCCLSGYG